MPNDTALATLREGLQRLEDFGITLRGGLKKRDHEGRVLPVCACCGKQVDSLESMRVRSSSSYTYQYGDQVLFRVHCHGRMQTSILNESDAAAGTQVSFGVAFLEEAACRAFGDGVTALSSPGRRFAPPPPAGPAGAPTVIDCAGVEAVDD